MNRFARFVYETPEATGGITLDPPEVETPALTPLRPDGRPVQTTVDPEVIEGAPAPIITPDPPLEGGADPDAPAGDPLKDTQRAFHESQQRLRELEAENEALRNPQQQPFVDPLAPLTAATPQMTEDEAAQMRDYIEAGPQAAYEWAQTPEAQAQWGRNIASDVLGYWQTMPGGHQASTDYLVDQRVSAATAPLLQKHAEDLGQQIEARLAAEIPTWTELRADVEKLYQSYQNDYGFRPNVSSPQAAEALLRDLHKIAYANKNPGSAPPPEAAPPGAGVLAAQTQGGSRAAAVGVSERAAYEEWAGPAVD